MFLAKNRTKKKQEKMKIYIYCDAHCVIHTLSIRFFSLSGYKIFNSFKKIDVKICLLRSTLSISEFTKGSLTLM